MLKDKDKYSKSDKILQVNSFLTKIKISAQWEMLKELKVLNQLIESTNGIKN